MSDQVILETESGDPLALEAGGTVQLEIERIPTPVLVPQDQDSYASAFLAALPSGRVWPRYEGATMPAAVTAMAGTPARFAALAASLLQEQPAGDLLALLPDWEATLGLPDPCAGQSPTVALRQRVVRGQIAAQGGQSIAYFTAVAASLGFAITVSEFEASRFGRPFGPSRRFGGEDWAFAWQVDVQALTVEPFLFGQGRFGEPFQSWGSRVLECTFERIGPAHCILTFSYTGSGGSAGLPGFSLGRDALA